MQLNFGEKIKRLRKSRDLTQEALADELGVSAQSVSKWECAYGFPDITQLPVIANFFGVTIDELLNNDKASHDKAHHDYLKRMKEFDEATEEKIKFIIDHCHRYPSIAIYSYNLCHNLSYHITKVCPENYDKYYPLLLETAKKHLDTAPNGYRDRIIASMINACPEEDLEEWLKLATHSSKFTKRNCLIERYFAHGETERQKQQIYLSNLETTATQLLIEFPDSAGAEAKAKYHRAILDTISSFGTDGIIPDGWLSYYGYIQLVAAGFLIGMGKKEEGRSEFCSAIDKLRRYMSFEEEYLDTGSPLFGGLRVNKNWHFAMDEGGEIHHMYGTAPVNWFADPKTLLYNLKKPLCPWPPCAIEEDYYKETIDWLEGLVKENNTAL